MNRKLIFSYCTATVDHPVYLLCALSFEVKKDIHKSLMHLAVRRIVIRCVKVHHA
jgi:hypothetical protein